MRYNVENESGLVFAQTKDAVFPSPAHHLTSLNENPQANIKLHQKHDTQNRCLSILLELLISCSIHRSVENMTGSGAKIGGVDVAALAPVITAVVAVLATFFFWFKTQRGGIVLQKNQKLDLQISQIVKVSDDTKQIRLAFPRSGMTLGLPVGKHFKVKNKTIVKYRGCR